MKLIRFIFIFLILSYSSFAQDTCPEYDRLIKEAETFFKQSEYRKALYKYNSAKTCSPSHRKEVDEKINQLFEKIENERIKAVANEKEIKSKHQELLAAKERERIMQERQKALELRDSIHFAENFIKKNKNLVDTILSAAERKQFFHHIESLRLQGQQSTVPALASSLLLMHKAGDESDIFNELYEDGLKITGNKDLFKTRSTAISHSGYIAYDSYYYWALEKITQAKNLLPAGSNSIYQTKIQWVADSLQSRRKRLEQNYWIADTVIDLYEKDNLFTFPCSDNQNFVWGYSTSSFDDYKKKNLKFLNLPVKDFSFTTDSLVPLAPEGRFYNVLASDADYRYMIVKEVVYSLKKNFVEFDKKSDASPAVIKLISKNGKVVSDFSSYSTGAYFFSPDASFVATWKPTQNNSFELILYHIITQGFWKLPHAISSNTMSFSSDSKTMVYYNDSTKHFYFLDLTGKKPEITASFSPGITGIENIDFTGQSAFLKINTPDKILLFNLAQKKVVFNFQNDFVKNIVVAPGKKDMLIICNRKGSTTNGFLTYRVDMELNIKDKLYSDCENYFYTPDEKYIVAYDQWNIMRWSTDRTRPVKNEFRACLGFTELLGKGAVPFNYFQTINDAVRIEKGARKLYDLGIDKNTDSVLANLYLRQSQLLFDRLKISDAQNLLKERIPFFYDWSNYIRKALGNRDFYEQFTAQQVAVETFDRLVNSPDSIYPQLLYYAANGNMLLGNLYDSLQSRNLNYFDLLKKEISLREKVFAKDPENDDNNYYLEIRFQKFYVAAENLSWRYLQNKQYHERLTLLQSAEEMLGRGWKSLPESFDMETLYINILTQLAPSYLYIYANKPEGNAKALDSAIYFADKGLALSPGAFDLATFLVVKARAYLLQNDGLPKALELFEKVIRDYPEFRKENMLQQLQLLREAGADELKIAKAEEFIRMN